MLARFILIISLLWIAAPAMATVTVHHRLQVKVEPEAGTLSVRRNNFV